MEERNLVIVAGVPGSGRQTFAACYKNSFLKSLPLLESKNDISKAKIDIDQKQNKPEQRLQTLRNKRESPSPHRYRQNGEIQNHPLLSFRR